MQKQNASRFQTLSSSKKIKNYYKRKKILEKLNTALLNDLYDI